MEVVTTKTISLLTLDVKSRKLTGISSDVMEEALKSLNIGSKILACQTNTTWDNLLVTEEAVKSLTRSILTIKSVRLQTKYTDTWITLQRVPMYAIKHHLEVFFTNYGQVMEDLMINGKVDIVTIDFDPK